MTEQLTTADWAGMPPDTKLYTSSSRNIRDHGPWGTRRVRKDGSVKWMGHWFRAPENAQIQPQPGEILVFTDYGERHRETRARMGEDPIHVYEWTAPGDPDGYIRRNFWVHLCCDEQDQS